MRNDRRTDQAIARVSGGGLVRQAAVDVEADVTIAKIDAITAATGQGLGAVAKVAQAELALAQNFPLASGRLAYVADRHMLGVGEILDGLQIRLRRQ